MSSSLMLTVQPWIIRTPLSQATTISSRVPFSKMTWLSGTVARYRSCRSYGFFHDRRGGRCARAMTSNDALTEVRTSSAKAASALVTALEITIAPS